MSVLVLSLLSLLVSVAVAPPVTTIPPPGPNDPALCGPYGHNKNYGTCSMVTMDKSFVDCNATTNRCYCLDTFSGNASPNNPCDCDAPNSVFVQANILIGGVGNLDSFGLGTPHCIDLPELLATDAADQRNAKHIASVRTFFLNTIGTKPSQILAPGGDAQLTNILAPNVKSRISPAGEFVGFEGVVEYFYGFVANPAFRVINVDFREIAATGNTVAAKANLFLNNSLFALTGGHPPQFWNLTTFAFFTFDDNDLIESIDVSVPNLGAILDIPDNFPGAAQIKFGIITSTCQLMLGPIGPPLAPVVLPNGFCGDFGIWAGNNPAERIATCINFMNNSIPYGTRYRNNANSFTCRSLHSQLIPFRQNPHCFHAGPDGGVGIGSPACIDFAYSDYYLRDF